MKNNLIKALLANIFGTLGYLFCLFSWCWVALLYLPMLLENEHVEQYILPAPTQEVVAQAPPAEMSLPMLILAVAITIFIIVATIFVLLRAPVTLAKTGRTVTTKAADSAVPLVTRGRPLPPAKKKRLTANLIKLMKLLLVLVPVILALLCFVIELPLPITIVLYISAFLTAGALISFCTQYLLAWLLKVDSKQLV